MAKKSAESPASRRYRCASAIPNPKPCAPSADRRATVQPRLIDSMVKTGWFPRVGQDRARLISSRSPACRRSSRRRDRGDAGRPGDGDAPRAMECIRRAMISDQPYEAARASARRPPMRPVCI